MTRLRRPLSLILSLLMLAGMALPAAAASRYTPPYDEVDLNVIDLYILSGGSNIDLNNAVISTSKNAKVSFYADEACTQAAPSPVTLTADTQFWARATNGSWTSKVRCFTVFVSGVNMTLTADFNEAASTLTLAATIERGARRRIPTGEIEFFIDGEQVGTANVSATARTVITVEAPAAGSYNLSCVYCGDENFPAISAEARAEISGSGITLRDPSAESAHTTFERYYSNRFATATLKKSGGAATTLTTHYILDMDISALNRDDIVFYLYDPAQNSYAPAVNAYVGSDGRVNIVTARGGVLIASEGELARR